MALLVGFLLPIIVGTFAQLVGFDRDRAFYPLATMVIASYYVLFAIMGDAPHALGPELVLCGLFVVAAVVGFRKSLWIVVAALAAHGLQDYVHVRFLPNPGVPAWWPAFCGTYDVVAAIFLAWLIRSGRVRA